jgi:outer membrane protein
MIQMQRECFRLFLLVSVLLFLGASASADSVDRYIREALAANPGTRAAWFRVRSSRAALKQAHSAYYPRLSAGASYTVTDNPPQSFMMELNQRRLDMSSPEFNPNTPDDTENIRFSLGLRYRLYDGQRGASTAMAKLGARLAESRLRAARNALIHEVTRGYYQVLQAQAFVTVQEQALKSLEESLRVARERFDAGSVVKTDVLNLEVRAAQASEDLIRARNGGKLTIAALNMTIGKDIVPATGIVAPATLAVVEPPQIASKEDTIKGRAEFQLAELMVRTHELTYKKSRRERGPVVNAFGSLDWDGEDLSQQEQSYLAGIAMEWEWFSGFQDQAAVAQAKAEWRAAQQERDQIRNQLLLDLRQAILTAAETRERLGVMRKSVSSAEEALRITRERYKEGSADITVLLMSEVGLTATLTRDTAATYDYQVALSNLDRACGELVKRYDTEQ